MSPTALRRFLTALRLLFLCDLRYCCIVSAPVSKRVVDAVMEKFAARVAKKRGTQRQASEADSDDEDRAKKVKYSDEDLYNMLIKG